jgi:tRNA pseudouridine38-40 synthase
MQRAAAMLAGEHDFSAFRAAECQARSPVKVLHEASVEQSGDLFLFQFRASAFLHHMVRNMVGALVQIGQGVQRPEWVLELLVQRDRRRAAPTFPPQGLYLCGIEYERRWRLPDNGRIIPAPLLPVP